MNSRSPFGPVLVAIKDKAQVRVLDQDSQIVCLCHRPAALVGSVLKPQCLLHSAKLLQPYLEQVFDLDRLVRSHVLYEAIAVEGVLDRIISSHFCPDETKHLWFQSLLFREGEVGFGKKIRIIKKLLRECYPDIFKLVPGLINKLDDIREIRNKFAHSELVLDENDVKKAAGKGVFLRTVRDGKENDEFISKEMADKICNDNNYFKFLLMVIWMEIQNRAQEKKTESLLSPQL